MSIFRLQVLTMEKKKMPGKLANQKAPADSQSWVMKQIIVGISLSVGLFLTAYNFLPIRITGVKSTGDSLVLAVRCLFISSLPVLAIMQSVGNIRFNTRAIDPVRGGGEDMVEVPNKILRNTTEQFLFHAVGLLTLSTFLDESSLRAIPILSCIFVIFRLLFWRRYLNSPLNRAVGMSGTAFPTILVYFYCGFFIVQTTILSQ